MLKQETDPTLRRTMAEPDLVDDTLDFGDLWFPSGRAFARAAPTNSGGTAEIRLFNPVTDTNDVAVAKHWLSIQQRQLLIESVDWPDIAPKLASLPQAGRVAGASNLKERVTQGRRLPETQIAAKHSSKPMRVASARYLARGFVFDYVAVPSSGASYTFASGTTYYISGGTYFSGVLTFQPNCVIKLPSSGYGYLLTYGSIVCNGTAGSPSVLTAANDNRYGESLPGNTGIPTYDGNPGLWLYYLNTGATVSGMKIRWARTAVQFDPTYDNSSYTFQNSALEQCQTGLFANAGATVSISNSTRCCVITDLYDYSNYPYTFNFTGSLTEDCGVVSIARVNDPAQDSASGDPNKNSQSECSFLVVDSSRILAAFYDTHLSEYALGQVNFPGIVSPRSTGWAVSVNGGASFTDNGAIPPTAPANTTQGDAGDPVMARDTGYGTIYLLVNPSRESATWGGFRLWKSTDNGQSFALVNTSVPSGVTRDDKPMIEWWGGFKRYQLQQTIDLSQPWQDVGSAIPDTSITNAITGSMRYFRVIGYLQ